MKDQHLTTNDEKICDEIVQEFVDSGYKLISKKRRRKYIFFGEFIFTAKLKWQIS